MGFFDLRSVRPGSAPDDGGHRRAGRRLLMGRVQGVQHVGVGDVVIRHGQVFAVVQRALILEGDQAADAGADDHRDAVGVAVAERR